MLEKLMLLRLVWSFNLIKLNFKFSKPKDQLPAFLKTAEKLKIKGLAEGEQGTDDGGKGL